MKLILFGGAEIGQGRVRIELKMIGKVIKRLKPKQVLHIPFCRIIVTEKEWEGDYFNENIKLKGIEYLNAKNKTDIAKAKHPLIFLSGGLDKENLIKKLKANPKLMSLVKNASYIIGESGGATVLGSYFRKGKDRKVKLAKGLNFIKNTVFKAHYIERKRQKELLEDMKYPGIKYGLGVDSMTAIEFDTKEFPKKYKKIGRGIVDLKIK